MKREILDKKNKLYKESTKLRLLALETDKPKGKELRKRQDEVFKRWKFYSEILKANDKIKRDN